MAALLQIPVQSYSNRALSSPSSSSSSLKNGGICRFHSSVSSSKSVSSRLKVRAVKEKVEEIETPSSSADEFTKKYGLEAGLWKVGHLSTLLDIRICVNTRRIRIF